MRALAIFLAACTGPQYSPDIRDAPPPPACTATYTGNLAETATSPTPCASTSGTMFTAAAPTTQLDAALVIAIDLGTTTITGDWTSATVATWSAHAIRTVTHQACTYSAGSAAAPHGDFTLALDAGHGTLVLDTYVLADPFTSCGDPLTLTLALSF